ncbi:MAG: Hsp20/alpha crystallin family protein [Candidatus Eisenbacteria bacterium]|uniref:Hsp20/alpha crystallin family protein n=1 Tax=Eiseniibacteriota bacterium TaxID=2212470 RepID=A0A538TNX6_UNCEI|nr:MAG: Hsp20/alpha crystallin family protein [Candidatus Eisenbacteria bacterium]
MILRYACRAAGIGALMTHEDALERVQREVERLWRDLVYRRHPAAHFGEQPWRESIRVRLKGSTLEVSGRRSPPQEQAGTLFYHRAEIYYGEFSRLIELPWEADEKQVQALYHNGMLEIRIPASVAPPAVEVPIKGPTT